MHAKCLQPGNPSSHHPGRLVIPHPPPKRLSTRARRLLPLSVCCCWFFCSPCGYTSERGGGLGGGSLWPPGQEFEATF